MNDKEFIAEAKQTSLITKPCGAYVVNKELHLTFIEKPCLFHRQTSKLFLGWEWVDYER